MNEAGSAEGTTGTQEMVTRTWLPMEWMDEVCPQTLPSPDGFLSRLDDGAWQIVPREVADGEDGWQSCITRLAPGQVVRFMWVEHYGFRTLTVRDDGTWSIDGSGFPDGTAHFWIPCDPDTLSESIDELVRGNDWRGPLEPGDHMIAGYTWSEPIAFEFVVDGATAGFVETGAVQ